MAFASSLFLPVHDNQSVPECTTHLTTCGHQEIGELLRGLLRELAIKRLSFVWETNKEFLETVVPKARIAAYPFDTKTYKCGSFVLPML